MTRKIRLAAALLALLSNSCLPAAAAVKPKGGNLRGPVEVFMPLDEARTNFETVVGSFLLRRRPGLMLAAVDGLNLSRLRGNRYAAPILLRDEASNREIAARAVVDFSESLWKVVEIKSIMARGEENPPRRGS